VRAERTAELGVNYNIGSFECSDQDGNLKSTFTFPKRNQPMEDATLAVREQEPLSLPCRNAEEASDYMFLFKDSFRQISHICSNVIDTKGTEAVLGISNSMGAVQITAIKVDGAGRSTSTLLNCKGVASKTDGPSW